jgi:hypothetical protein
MYNKCYAFNFEIINFVTYKLFYVLTLKLYKLLPELGMRFYWVFALAIPGKTFCAGAFALLFGP